MAHPSALTRFFSLLALSLLLVLAGCNDFDSAFDVGDDSWRTSDAFFTAQVGGSVGDGPIVNARLRVFSNSGRQLLETYSNDTADFNLRVRARGNEYPLTIVADQGVDIVTNAAPDFSLVSVIMSPGNNQTANLTPYSTLIVKAAEKGGGIDEKTIATATEAVVTRYGFGLNTDLVPDVLFSPMTDDNVHVIVKASETLGETIRRTRDKLITSGTSLHGNDVVAALAADLTDGWIDGRGAEGHDPRIAAVANVASSAVMVEAMANRLHVEGVDATTAMDNAIRHVRPNAPASSNTRNVSISAEALDQSLRSLRAAKLVKHDSRITEIYERVASAKPGKTEFDALSSDGIQTMSSGFHNPLNDAILDAAYILDETRLKEINGVASMDSPDPVPEEDEKQDDGTKSDPVIEEEEKQDDSSKSDPVIEEEEKQEDETKSDPVIEEEEKKDDGTRSDPVIEEEEEKQEDGTAFTLWSNDGWLLFDGVSDAVPTSLSLPRLAGSSFTAEVTVQYTGETSRTWTPIFGASYEPEYTHSESFFIGKDRENERLNINIGGLDRFVVTSGGLFDGRERHLALVFDDTAEEFRIFVDQELIHTRTGVAGSLSTSGELLIGAVGHTTDERWMGWIGPARITGSAMEPHEFLIGDGNDATLEPRPNSAPTISGTPTTALVVGNPWSFTPTASDPDGEALTFSIQGKPEWASFDTETGRLWGTPTAQGSYGPITITASDGRAEVSLDPFTLQVDEPTLGTATVSWEPPTTRTDGSALTDLAGYRVYYGKDKASLTHTLEITNVGQTSQFIENLDQGTWYFAVTAICSKGLESPKSEIGSKGIL